MVGFGAQSHLTSEAKQSSDIGLSAKKHCCLRNEQTRFFYYTAEVEYFLKRKISYRRNLGVPYAIWEGVSVQTPLLVSL